MSTRDDTSPDTPALSGRDFTRLNQLPSPVPMYLKCQSCHARLSDVRFRQNHRVYGALLFFRPKHKC